MAVGQRVEGLGLSSHSFSAHQGRVGRKILAGSLSLVLAVAVVAVLRSPNPGRVELADRNEFESEPAWDAAWSTKDLQHHLVRMQRKQTASNKKMGDEIGRLDADVEDLMKMFRNRPLGPAGEPGPEGSPGAPGEPGSQGPMGEAGPDGVVGAKGLPGPDGAPGPKGEMGVAGAPGAIGIPGPPGQMGKMGPRGQDGPQGQRGQVGVQGTPGFPGRDGPPGDMAGIIAHHHSYQSGSQNLMQSGASVVKGLKAVAQPTKADLASMSAKEAFQSLAGSQTKGDITVTKLFSPHYWRVSVPHGHEVQVEARGSGTDASNYDRSFTAMTQVSVGRLPNGQGPFFIKAHDSTSGETQYFKIDE